MASLDFRALNLANWNSRVPFHERGYGLDRYRADPAMLSGVVQFDLPRLGSVAGLDAVHLQCHLGTDTLSLARLGARMTGLDFSGPALAVARRLAEDCGAKIEYVEADVYRAVEALGAGRFDLVYTGMGALCWLPDVRRWARVVGAILRPRGRLFLSEFHPMLWALGPARPDGALAVEYPYFETKDGIRLVEKKTYVAHEGELAAPESVEWNHGLGEIVTALADAGLTLAAFEEHDSVPFDFRPGDTTMDERGRYRLRDRPERLAASYTLQATKR
jgi:SAM-dependent methyltransferase